MAAFVQQVHLSNTTSGTHAIATAATVVGNIIIVQTYDAGTQVASTVTDDQGGTYTRVAFCISASSVNIMSFYIRDQLITTTTAHTISSAPGATSGGGLQVTEYSGITRIGSSAARQSAKQDNQTAATTPAPAFTFAALTTNPVIGGIINAATTATVTEPTGWTERRDSGFNTPPTGFEGVTRDSGFTGTTVTWGSTSPTAFGSMIVELDTSAVPPGTGHSVVYPQLLVR